MNRVASVTLLKDAAAKAIYGSRAANGVVVIETIQPEKGKLKVSYTGDLTVTAPDLTSYDLCDATEKLEVERTAGRYNGHFPVDAQWLAEEYNVLKKRGGTWCEYLLAGKTFTYGFRSQTFALFGRRR